MVAAVWVGGAPAAVSAAPSPSVPELRAELERVRVAQAGRVPDGALESIAYTIDVAERVDGGRFAPQAGAWRARAADFLALAQQGEDPLLAQRGKIVMRGYRSPVSLSRQGYAIYLPPGYDPSKAYPLMLVLHGGSANGNLFLGVVLGNNMNWKDYAIHLWDSFEPRWSPDWIVVAPDGFGQVMWRWMGERDVLDVLADVERHYHVDTDRVVLCGLSNGGVGAYGIGMRHASRFAAVLPIAGAPSWLQYAGGRPGAVEQRLLHPLSGMSLLENAVNTDFRYFHGRTDTGPMRPAFVEELGRRIRALGVPFREQWYDLGHDLLYPVHRHGTIYDGLTMRRNRRPKEVRVVTGDYRANRQHWLTVTRIDGYPALARARAVVEGDAAVVETTNVRAFSIDLRDAPLADGSVRIVVNGREAYRGERARLGHLVHLTRGAEGWRTGFPAPPRDGTDKRPGLSGPITDAYFDAVAHVYGTADPSRTAALRRAAERGAKGWPLWLWRVEQPVVADTDVTDELVRTHHLVLYATPGANQTLERMIKELPIHVDGQGVQVGARRFVASGVGVKFVFPNPLATDRYVIVQAAPTPDAVDAGNRLPDFLPDWVVYDAASTRTRPRLVSDPRHAPLAQGFFDDDWRLEGDARSDAAASGASVLGPAGASAPESPGGAASDDGEHYADVEPPGVPAGAGSDALAPVPKAPPRPPTPTTFLAPADNQAGRAAREIAALAASFGNLRAGAPGARWFVDPGAQWSIRANEACFTALRKAGVRTREWRGPLSTPVPAPVELDGPVGHVTLRNLHPKRPFVVSCELAARLPVLAEVLHRHGVRAAGVMSAYRDHPRTSFHTFGLALDLSSFETTTGTLWVETDFQKTPAHPTCEGPRPTTRAARTLRDIACDLARTRRFSSVLTPNYNEGHHNHFHVDIRPDDPRLFVR
jgi:enterochelin esterase-like enzyme